MTLTAQQSEDLKDLAARVLRLADNAGCKQGQSTILVVNFTGPAGSTSKLGMELAEAIAEQLAATAADIQAVYRPKYLWN